MPKNVWPEKVNNRKEPRWTAEEITVDADTIQAYLQALREKGLEAETQRLYRNKLLLFYRFILPEGRIGPHTLEAWIKELETRFAASTINFCLSIINGFLEWLGRRDLQMLKRLKEPEVQQPELSRSEYHRLLCAAIEKKDEFTYLMVKLFATTGVSVQEIPRITVEEVRDGEISENTDSSCRKIRIPPCVRTELLSYAERQGLHSGLLFRSARGNTVHRSVINANLKKLCAAAHVAEEKVNPRILQKLYLTVREEMDAQFAQLLQQSYDHLLEAEQATIGWPEEL